METVTNTDDNLPKQGRKDSRWLGEPIQDGHRRIYNHNLPHSVQLPYGVGAD